MAAYYGIRGWPRWQLTMIVAEYWRKGERPAVVAAKLGISQAMVQTMYGHVEWYEAERRTHGRGGV